MIAYIILAHRNPAQVRRLVARLLARGSRCYIHVDKKAEIAAFKWAMDELPEQSICYLDQLDTRWGEYSLVEATLSGLRAAVRGGTRYAYYVLLSGQSYPIKDADAIHDVLADGASTSYIDIAEFPSDKRDRLESYYFNWRGWRRTYPSAEVPQGVKDRILQRLFSMRFRMPREFPAYVRPYFGSQWWCLSRAAVAYTLDFVQEHPDFVKFHRYANVPDEMFFQTILANGPPDIAADLVRSSRHFVDWPEGGQPSPAVLTGEHFEKLAQSDCLFARKFDTAVDAEILDRIDAELLGRRG